MSKSQNPKRRHHHVWQHYLKPWTNNGSIWCLQDGKIFSTGTTVVAIERDFYKVSRLNNSQTIYLKKFFSFGNNETLDKNHHSFIDMVQAPYQIMEIAKKTLTQEEINEHLNNYSLNALEDYHAKIEASFAPYLKQALQKDTRFYLSDDSCIDFLHYICTQYMRTKGIKEKTIQANINSNLPDLTPMWNMMIHMFAVNIGWSLFAERQRRKLVIIENNTNTPFITGDQPAINIKAKETNQQDEFSIYYPISPSLALILCEVNQDPTYPEHGISALQVSELNQRIVRASYKQIFSHSKEYLETISKQST
ncbi:DUF4238 domain-containing protein [Chromobacterium vaccinii]|uniref:DUF4238 domain-containing protein n=1 Tax=Chromobacterium vaccinii TaxID=1108595 RepID=UPI0009E37AE4|nr:DUF4238 domain-containing protein [Chromobacterium vaccinii]